MKTKTTGLGKTLAVAVLMLAAISALLVAVFQPGASWAPEFLMSRIPEPILTHLPVLEHQQRLIVMGAGLAVLLLVVVATQWNQMMLDRKLRPVWDGAGITTTQNKITNQGQTYTVQHRPAIFDVKRCAGGWDFKVKANPGKSSKDIIDQTDAIAAQLDCGSIDVTQTKRRGVARVTARRFDPLEDIQTLGSVDDATAWFTGAGARR